MPNEIIKIDSYQPDYKRKCCNCGQTPVVTGVKGGKVVYKGEMCGPCTWGESETIDPATWNGSIHPSDTAAMTKMVDNIFSAGIGL